MSQVAEVQIYNTLCIACLLEILARRALVETENVLILVRRHLRIDLALISVVRRHRVTRLPHDDFERVANQRDPLIVADLLPGMLAIAHQREVILGVDIVPTQAERLATAERTLHGDAQQIRHRLLTLRMLGEPRNDFLDFFRCWSALTLAAGFDQARWWSVGRAVLIASDSVNLSNDPMWRRTVPSFDISMSTV